MRCGEVRDDEEKRDRESRNTGLVIQEELLLKKKRHNTQPEMKLHHPLPFYTQHYLFVGWMVVWGHTKLFFHLWMVVVRW